MKHRTKINIVLVCVLLFIMLLPVQVLAAGDIDSTKPASLTIVYKDNDTYINGASFDLYQVAKSTENSEYVLTGKFAELPIDVDSISAENMQYLSLTLEAYANLYDVPPVKSDITNNFGSIEFKDLETGLYLVTGQTHTQDGFVYTTEPFLVFLPVTDATGDSWVYDVTARPKFSSTPQGETTELKVIKVWKDDGNESSRPSDITVHLLKDGEIYDTIKLNSDNNWRWSWTELDGEHTWSVAEVVPAGYTVEITRNGNTYTCVNTKPHTPPPPPPDLPHTGQLWWPVPMLVAVGFAMIIIGIIRRRGGSNEA